MSGADMRARHARQTWAPFRSRPPTVRAELQAFSSIRSERQSLEQFDDTLLFRWFVGLSMASRNQERD